MQSRFQWSWRRHKEWWLLAIATAAAAAFTLAMLLTESFLINVGFLILGTLVAIGTGLISDQVKRPAQARDLARALYIELTDRVARCCFDAENPWNEIRIREAPQGWDSLRLRKFVPNAPVIYPAAAGQLALLPGEAPQALVHFYYRLAAWQRDVENIAAEYHHNRERIPAHEMRFLSIRLHQTLSPGLKALETLAPIVDGHVEIEAQAIAAYDSALPHTPPEGTLRDRIGRLTTQVV